METATAESFPSNQNGAINYRPLNNFDHANDDDDFGPETNVDNIDDVMSQAVPTKKSFLDSDTIKTSFDQLHSDVLVQPDQESKIGIKEADEILDNGKEALSESEDDDDEEGWDYFKVGANSKEISQPKLDNSDELLSNEMDYTLNPDAEEFVPVSPKSTRESSQSPEICSYPLKNTERLLKEEFIASSPLKGQEKNMDDVDVPTIADFEREIKKRPSNIMPRFDSDEPNVENYELNNGDALLEHSLENAANDNTYASTNAVFGDDSTYATNLEEVNKALKDVKDNYDERHVAENGIDEAISNYQEYNHENERNEANDLLTKSTIDSNADNVSENGAFESEDYPSIVEKEKPTEDESDSILSSSNITYNRDSGKYDAEKEVPPFEDLLEKHDDFVPKAATDDTKDPFGCLSFTNDSTSEVIQKMTNFDYGTTLQSSLLDNDTNFGANTPTSPTLEIYNGDLSNSTNPFSVDAKNEKDIAEEKETDDDEDVQIKQFDPFNDQVDFKESFQTQYADASAPQLSFFEKAPIEEPVLKEEVGQVEANPESDKHVESTQPEEPLPNDDVSAQILDLDEYELNKSGSSEELDEQVSNLGATTNDELPVSSVDMETPYIHDCSRISEKPDSVHEPVPRRHFDDLYPDTMESDKLELELRESDTKADKFDTKPQDDEFQSLMVDLVKPAEVVPETKIEEPAQVTNEAEFIQKDDIVKNDVISVPEVSSNVETELTNEEADNIATPPPTAVAENQQENVVSIAEAVDKIHSQEQENNAAAITAAVAAVGVATAVAAGVAISQDKKEAPPKRASIIRKPEEKPKAPAKTTKAPLSSAKPKPATTTSTLRTTTSTLAPKKPATSAAKSTAVKSTVTARPSAAKPTTPTSKSTLTSKPSTAKPTTPTASKPITKPASPLKSRPTTASSLSSPRSTTTKPLTNGDVSSTTKTAPRKPSLSAIKKTVSSPTTSAPPASNRPAVNLATRTSLAPKPKPALEKPKTTSAVAKRPLSAPSAATKVTNNKDSKDSTNKRLSTSKPASRLSTTVSKTESKVNTGLKSTKSVVKTASDINQSEATKTVNGNA